MKIIHCADLHLDSRMDTHLSKESAAERKAELLRTFSRMTEYAACSDVSAIIIAGDLFDKKSVSAAAKNTVYSAVKNNPDIIFFYLCGNHDTGAPFIKDDEIPPNLKLFDNGWTSYEIGSRILVTGTELGKTSPADIYGRLSLDKNKINIVTLHGMENEYGKKSDAEIIGFSELRNKNIDYLALGHIHSYKSGRLDARGIYCYSGCLEGRGFDECGKKGFVMLDIDEDNGTVSSEFIPFAYREFCDVRVDVSGCSDSAGIIAAVQAELSEIDDKNIVLITLCGEVGVECEKDERLIKKQLEDRFYFVRVKDKTKLKVDYASFKNDFSLKGEFVRCVEAAELSEDDKAAVIRYGIQALMGEDIG